ncbi:MAG: hypothetical protein EOP05_11965 [Proteobacteria bacterium]|nr:MAG: hypothetical protein EOP05_11965 [Pseudomonadota bacterium]
MKRRLASAKGIALHELLTEDEIADLRPTRDSIFLFHLSRKDDVKLVVSQILQLVRAGGPTVINVVVSELKDTTVKTVIETLPQTHLYSADRPAHDIDQLVLKLVKQQKASLEPIRKETLKYEIQKESFIAKERETTRTITAESEIIAPKAPSQNKFRPVTEPDLQKKLIDDALDSKAKIVLSNFGFNDEIKGTFQDLDAKKKRVFVELKGTAAGRAAFQEKSKDSKKIAISISLKQSRVFFVSTDFSWASDGRIELKIPSLVYFVQRRKDFRLTNYPTELFKISFEVGGTMRSYPIFDISASGVSVLCPPDAHKLLQATPEPVQSRLTFDENDWNTGPLKFRQSQLFIGENDEELIKAGYSFEKLPTVYKKNLGDYIDRKARAYVLSYSIES